MKNLKKKLEILLLILFGLTDLSFEKTAKNHIPEESFIIVKPYEINKFEISSIQKEVYYIYENYFDDSDLVINLQIGNCFTVHGYFYDSYDSINIDDKGEYIDYIKDIVLNEKLLFIKNSETKLQKKKYYIILKDIFGAKNKDYISFYNEQDIMPFLPEEPVIIDMFFSKNKRTFTFYQEIDETTIIELNTINEDYSQFVIIYLNNEEVYRSEKNKGTIKFNEKKNTEGKYIMEIYSLEESYNFLKSTIILHKQKRNVLEIVPDKYLTLSYGNSRIFNFFLNIEDYELNEEGIISFKFDNQIFDKKILEHCYAKTMNFFENDDNKFIANMPANEEENEAVMERFSNSENIYFLYFKKTKQNEINKRTYLLIHLSIKVDEEIFVFPQIFNVFLGIRHKKINLNDYYDSDSIINKKINLSNYIPHIFRISVSLNNDLSYLFYCSENVQTVYNDTMLNQNYSFENTQKLYTISYNNKKNSILYIKLYGTEREIYFRIESTKSPIYYLNEELRPIKSLSQKHTNCGQGFYYIGNYGILNNKGYFFLEELSGKYNIYYKGIINVNDSKILINEDSKFLLNGNIGNLNTSIDIIELQCIYPGYFNLHLINEIQQTEISMYSRLLEYLSPTKPFKVIPKISPNTINIKIEISTPNGKEIKINNGKEEITINSKNKYYRVEYENYLDVPSSFLLSSIVNSVFSFKLTNDENFKIIQEDYSHLEGDSELIIKLKNNLEYKNINININRIYHEFSYSIFSDDPRYSTKQSLSRYDFFPPPANFKINLSLSNIYDYYYLTDFSQNNSSFYVSISITDPEILQRDLFITYEPIPHYEKINIGEPKTIRNSNINYSVSLKEENKDIKIIYQSCGQSLKDVILFHYDDVIIKLPNNNSTKYELKNVHNYKIDTQIGISLNDNLDELYKGAIVGLSNSNISQSDIDKLNEKSINITQNGKKIKWENLENSINYDIFVINKDYDDIKNLHNPCFLDSIKNNYTKIKDNSTYIKYYSTKLNYYTLSEEGFFTVIVSASIKDPIPLIFIYNELDYDSNSPPYEEDEDKEQKKERYLLFIVFSMIIVSIIVFFVVFIIIRGKKEPRISIDNPLIRPSETEKSSLL